jgi:hypothetical protein
MVEEQIILFYYAQQHLQNKYNYFNQESKFVHMMKKVHNIQIIYCKVSISEVNENLHYPFYCLKL